MAADATTEFQFDLVSPEAVLLSEPMTRVIIPGAMGEFGVLADHAPLLSALRPGVVAARGEGKEERLIFVTGGVADINDNLCTVLAEDAVDLKDIDEDELKAAVETLKEQHARHIGMDEEHYIRRQLEIMLAKLDAVTTYKLK